MSFAFAAVLWQGLIDEWRLTPAEIEYINRQQGFHCAACHSNLRSMALASAILRFYAFTGTLAQFVESAQARNLNVLEINAAGGLTPFLRQLPGHLLRSYPEIDMHAIAFDDGRFDLVVHSDTLEHVAHPVRALSECRRVLRLGGACIFTIPMLVGRLTISRAGMPPSYHGNSAVDSEDHLVRTEYGVDAWTQILLAGFRECRINAIDYPAANAFTAIR